MCVDGPWSGGYAGSVRSTAITIILELQPDVERGLLEQAHARGMSLTDYVREIVTREAGAENRPPAAGTPSEARNLVELFAASPFRGLDMEFERDKDLLSPRSPNRLSNRTGKDLVDASQSVRGLLTDEEVDKLLSRSEPA